MIATLVALLMMSATASAQQSSVSGYGPKDTDVLGEVAIGGPSGGDPTSGDSTNGVSPSTSGGLPFTGIDIGLMAGGAIVLIVAGASLARATRPKRTAA